MSVDGTAIAPSRNHREYADQKRLHGIGVDSLNRRHEELIVAIQVA